MSKKLPPFDCDDPSTWRHKGVKIDLPRLLHLIEQNGGPRGLDLHGCNMEHIDARPEALLPYVDDYLKEHGQNAWPPWLATGLKRSINLREAHLENASLLVAHLENANLEHAHLENASLMLAQLENANLSWSHLEKASLEHAHLENANLSDAHLENANLQHAHLENASLSVAHLQNANLSGAHLQNASLIAAHLENANLSWSHLENASLEHAHLENASLYDAHLEDAALVGARLYGVFWYGSYLDRTRMRRESLGEAIGDELAAKAQASSRGLVAAFHHAREAYLSLKTNFESIGRYDDASWAYVKEQQMEKAMYFPTTAGHTWIRQRIGGAVPPPWWPPHHLPRWIRWKLRSTFYHTRLFFPFPGLCPRELREQMAGRSQDEELGHEWLNRPRWLRNWFYEATCGYGENPWRPLICAAVVVLLFAAIYAAAGSIASGDVGALEGQPTHSPFTALVHSISAFATIGFNTLEPQGWVARLLTALEAMFGIGLFALFVFTLGNRMRRS